MKLPFIRGVASLFFWPTYAKRISREHHSYLNSPKRIENNTPEESWPDEQITILRRSWLLAFATVAVVLMLGWVAGHLLTKFVTHDILFWQAALQYTGAGMLLWVTLGQGGWSIQSMKGTTYAEQLDGWVYRVIHVAGTLLFVAGTTWSLAERI